MLLQDNKIIWQRRILNFFYPVFFVFFRLAGKTRQELEKKYIYISNKINKKQNYKISAEKILLLVPHCLQKDACPHKVTRHLENCRECGGCRIGDLIKISKKYGCNLAVVTGGTLARQTVIEFKPQAIIAVACERDLASGIMDVFPMPVIGVLNERPFGPCFNTDVDTDLVDKNIQFFMGTKNV